MKRIALINQKGGCGKTTTAINLASCLSMEGKKVLLIDLDPQGHSALGLGVKPDEIVNSIFEVLLRKVSISEAIQTVRENLDAVFSNVVLSAFEQIMAGVPDREYILTRCLEEIGNRYDYLIIDNPPGVGLLTFNGLMASQEVIIPVDPSSFALQGLEKLLETMQLLEKTADHKLSIKILATNVDRRTRFARRVVEELKTNFPVHCFKTIINTSTRLREAASHGKPIGEYDKNCASFRDYYNLTEEILTEAAEKKTEISIFESLLNVDRSQRRPEGKEILFALEAPEEEKIQIAGDFNGWMPQHLRLTYSEGKPMWRKIMRLKPGTYQYKYLIDNKWVADPGNHDTVDDLFGGLNSIVRV
ncbi:MAG: AAA family ATPase [Pseudomonadota bacterium]